jgi:predicted TIM-barrel fold metal-dependent hydrolase
VFFGTDWPLLTEIYTQQEWVTEIRGLEHPPALEMVDLPEITDEDKTRILGTNAQQGLGLQCGPERPRSELSAAAPARSCAR